MIWIPSQLAPEYVIRVRWTDFRKMRTVVDYIVSVMLILAIESLVLGYVVWRSSTGFDYYNTLKKIEASEMLMEFNYHPRRAGEKVRSYLATLILNSTPLGGSFERKQERKAWQNRLSQIDHIHSDAEKQPLIPPEENIALLANVVGMPIDNTPRPNIERILEKRVRALKEELGASSAGDDLDRIIEFSKPVHILQWWALIKSDDEQAFPGWRLLLIVFRDWLDFVGRGAGVGLFLGIAVAHVSNVFSSHNVDLVNNIFVPLLSAICSFLGGATYSIKILYEQQKSVRRTLAVSAIVAALSVGTIFALTYMHG